MAAPISQARPNVCAAPCMVARQLAHVATIGIATVDVAGPVAPPILARQCRATAHGAAVPGRFTASTVPRAWNYATRRGHTSIHLLRPLPRPVPPMNFAPATTPALHGIKLCAGVELRVDEHFATGCFTHFRYMFESFTCMPLKKMV